MKPPDNETRAYESDDRQRTIAFYAAERTLALPYDAVESLELVEDQIVRIHFDDHVVELHGSNLEKLWRELCAYRVHEVRINGGAAAKALGTRVTRCLIEQIEVNRKEDLAAA